MRDELVGETSIFEFTFTVEPGDDERFEITMIPLKSIDSNSPIDPSTTIVGEDANMSR